MRILKQSLGAIALSAGLMMTMAVPPPAAASARFDHDRDRDYDGLRGLVDRTQSDLRAAVDLEHGGKQAERYKNAQDHLSDFDRSLAKGHFNKDRLDSAINDLQHLLDHNTLQASTRDALHRDLEDLRIARERNSH
jgi:hypothetical protein